MRYLLSVSILLLAACAPHAYKSMHRVDDAQPARIAAFRPRYNRVLYRATVDVMNNHLSGLLLVKQMPDSSLRIVFNNEAGFTFFDFGYAAAKGFTTYRMMDKMDKEAVKTTLQKDFALVFFLWSEAAAKEYTFKNIAAGERYTAYKNGNDYFYYITDTGFTKLLRMERGDEKRKVLAATAIRGADGVWDSIAIHHVNFNFDIQLKRIEDHADE